MALNLTPFGRWTLRDKAAQHRLAAVNRNLDGLRARSGRGSPFHSLDPMSTQTERLESWKQIAQIISALAIPVVLALIGYFVQRSLADAGLKKDYVQMALGVLKDQPTKENAQLRQWAIAVLDKNSPVPIPSTLKSQLATTKVFDAFFTDGFKFEESVECKSVPNPQTLEWLIENDPSLLHTMSKWSSWREKIQRREIFEAPRLSSVGYRQMSIFHGSNRSVKTDAQGRLDAPRPLFLAAAYFQR
ncbi:hypothetical protein LP415_05625 [Polaromonas sp. P1(28)-8]|nr:hypothetical protein LP415_05625 [Polaromonas sp. P1(28)-8]